MPAAHPAATCDLVGVQESVGRHQVAQRGVTGRGVEVTGHDQRTVLHTLEPALHQGQLGTPPGRAEHQRREGVRSHDPHPVHLDDDLVEAGALRGGELLVRPAGEHQRAARVLGRPPRAVRQLLLEPGPVQPLLGGRRGLGEHQDVHALLPDQLLDVRQVTGPELQVGRGHHEVPLGAPEARPPEPGCRHIPQDDPEDEGPGDDGPAAAVQRQDEEHRQCQGGRDQQRLDHRRRPRRVDPAQHRPTHEHREPDRQPPVPPVSRSPRHPGPRRR